MPLRKPLCWLLAIILMSATALAVVTWVSIVPVNGSLNQIARQAERVAITDRNGIPLSISYQNRWNSFDYVPLHNIPDFLVQSLIISEDSRFYAHNGVDWKALGAALWQNLQSFSKVRGASTISEQVVRILHPRPRTLWSKWLEIWEALLLEQRESKAKILEFYCNEVPYASNRRGVSQAASYYFNRDLPTLTQKEMLALIVLARAPSSYDLYRNPSKINTAIQRLTKKLHSKGLLTPTEVEEIASITLYVQPPDWTDDARHFVSYVRQSVALQPSDRPLRTTLNATLQRHVREILEERLKSLSAMNVHNVAVLVADHRTAEILAWVVVGGDQDSGTANPNDSIDAVTVPRQPGSALKPLLYAAALDKGWTAATLIDDSPLSEGIGLGLHEFKNYSRTFYGKVTLREALANSLNIPALRTIDYVGVPAYLNLLHTLGFESLTRSAETYNTGLALGNGEVRLFEMVQGYTALANQGIYRPLRYIMENAPIKQRRVYTPEAASLIGDILSDPWARRLEFGYNSVLNLPIQTAVKTGTSTDYRDAWTMGFDSHYVVGIWMGNLDRRPMDGVTGAIGPALALRSIFAELHKDGETKALYLSPKLIQKQICVTTGPDGPNCHPRTELFAPGTENEIESSSHRAIALSRPTQGLQMAYDPRIPEDRQYFEFRLEGLPENCPTACEVTWMLNGEYAAKASTATHLWKLKRGKYDLQATVTRDNEPIYTSGIVHFVVK